MTFAVIPRPLVSTYSSTGVPSSVLPNACFWMPAFTFAPPFAPGPASPCGAPSAQKAATTTPAHMAHRCMSQLLGGEGRAFRPSPCPRLENLDRVRSDVDLDLLEASQQRSLEVAEELSILFGVLDIDGQPNARVLVACAFVDPDAEDGLRLDRHPVKTFHEFFASLVQPVRLDRAAVVM